MDIGLSLNMKQTGASAGGGDSTPWYLAGGVDAANCVAAYQAKGAASYAASKVNLANPGTHDLTDGPVPMLFDSSCGWKNDNTDNMYLVTDLTAEDIGRSTGSYLARVQGWSSDTFVIGVIGYTNAGGEDNDYIGMVLVDDGTTTWNGYLGANNYIPFYSAGTFRDVVCGMAGLNSYIDGVAGTTGTSWQYPAQDIWPIYIGAQHYLDGTTGGSDYKCSYGIYKAVVFYNITLTEDQVAAITTAMQAL